MQLICTLVSAHMSRVVRKPAFCICENKDTDQLHSKREADQHLCFRYIYSMIPLLSKSEISSLQPSSVVVQPGLCRTWSETPKTGFLTGAKSRFSHYGTLYLAVTSNQSVQLQNWSGLKLSLVVRKPVFGVSDQVRQKTRLYSHRRWLESCDFEFR